jgi:hypothetical protein
MKNNRLTLFIPIHKLLKSDVSYLDKCMESLGKQDLTNVQLLFNCTESIKKKIEAKYPNFDKTFYTKNGSNGYVSKVNFAIDNLIETDYFMIYEFDDTLNNAYINDVLNHIDAYPDIDAFLPIVNETDKNGGFIALKNEVTWAHGYMSEHGKYDIDKLLQSGNFSIVSTCFKTEVLRQVKFKENIKVFFNYEFFLRFLNKGFTSYVIPKIGVKHTNQRENSFFEEIVKNYDEKKRQFWYEQAKKEYHFDKDRTIHIPVDFK